MGNSCNHEHLEEIEEDTNVFAVRGGEEDICQNIHPMQKWLPLYYSFVLI